MAEDATIDRLMPPWWWTQRLGGGFLVLVAAMFILRFFAGRATQHRVDAFAAAVRARGSPWTIDDLHTTPSGPAQLNAATFYTRAFALENADHCGPGNSNFDFTTGPRHSEIWRWLALAADARYQPMFDLAHQAAQLKGCDWQFGALPSANLVIAGKYLSPCRALANEIGDQSLYRHFMGDEITCLRCVDDNLSLSRAVGSGRVVVNRLVSDGIIALALARLQVAIPDLHVGQPEITVATRKLLLTLKEMEPDVVREGVESLYFERLFGRSYINQGRGNAWLTAPLFAQADVNSARITDATSAIMTGDSQIESSKLSLLFETIARPNKKSSFWPGSEPAAAVLWPFLPMLNRYAEAQRRIVMELRLTEVMLAARLYYNDHHAWPADSAALVPDYLSAVPRGTERSTVTKVEFVVLRGARPDGADRPMVYIDRINDIDLPVNSEPATSWQSLAYDPKTGQDVRANEHGRQWRDMSVWPLAAYPKSIREPAVASDEDRPTSWENWDNPGNPAALQHPPEYPQKPKNPRDGDQPE